MKANLQRLVVQRTVPVLYDLQRVGEMCLSEAHVSGFSGVHSWHVGRGRGPRRVLPDDGVPHVSGNLDHHNLIVPLKPNLADHDVVSNFVNVEGNDALPAAITRPEHELVELNPLKAASTVGRRSVASHVLHVPRPIIDADGDHELAVSLFTSDISSS